MEEKRYTLDDFVEVMKNFIEIYINYLVYLYMEEN